VFKISCVPLSYHVKTGNEFCQGFLGLKELMLCRDLPHDPASPVRA